MGKTLNDESTGSKRSVASRVRGVYLILINKGTDDNRLCDVWHSKAWTEFTSEEIIKAVRTTAKTLKL